MPLVVEDGTGKPDSNSYGSVEDADTYHNDRGNGLWSGLTPEAKASSLIKATDYIDGRFGPRFIGDQKSTEQALEWPRTFDGKTYEEVYGGDGEIPKDLKYATYEYAIRASQAPLAPDPVISDAGVSVITTHQRVGEVERSFAPIGGSGSGSVLFFRPYPAADIYLVDLLRLGYGGDRVIR